MCVVSHDYSGFGGGRDGGGGLYACGTKPTDCPNVGRCQSTSQVRSDTLMTPDHTALQVRSSA